ncbi:toxin-antitoxin system YwqK family antitoxin [uncultured Winogradskyella sp.]|uniref:toxin-antitoxin system YwqK family antitoxin n=1 Tax=uncultured Winogradskyella sp. TaxID=395353 RepID=UPI002606059F|nr:hypothetical protein [uncultured Winogradskyella sp.]
MLLFVVALQSLTLSAQQDTIYYNIDWKETVKDSAAFYRTPIKKEGDLFRIEDYYASGQLQMSGLSKSSDKAIWHGVVSWYNEDGKLYQSGNYKNNRIEGEFISFLNDKKLVAIYKDGYFKEGAMNRGQGRNKYYTEIKNDTLKDIVYDGDINGVRYENYSVINGSRFLSKYYNDKGELLGKLERVGNGYNKGVEVYYYYNPMRVKQIRYYPYDYMLGETFFYDNGQIRTKFELEPEIKNTYYTIEGDELGSVTYTMQNNYLKAENGSEYNFSYDYSGSPVTITSIRTYKDGKLQKEELYYENGKVKSINTYIDNKKEIQISYNESGKEIARMTYNDYYPLTGTEIVGDRKATYKEGELIKEVNYYPKTKLVFSEKTKEEETYFDKEGNILGSLELEFVNQYGKPMNGMRFYSGYDTDISSIETYEDGYVIERTVFRIKKKKENEKIKFKHTEYFKSGSYNKYREIIYYSNGSKQSDIQYNGYDKKLGKFFNEKSELIGTYDYVKKTGIMYEFFYESNIVQLVKEVNNGTLIKSKKYDYGLNRSYDEINPVLIEETDVNCCATSYLRNGEVFAKAIYKDGHPWDGTVYDYNSHLKYTIKEGKRNGIYQKFDYNQDKVFEEGQYVNDKREGVFKTYNYLGQLKYSQTYQNDVLNGKAVYFDKEGNETSTLIYKNDLPFEGVKIIAAGYNSKPTEETYSNGLLTQRVSFDETGKRVSTFENGKKIETIAYHKDSDKKRLKYTVDNYYINGKVIRYDESGKEQHKAIFKNNKLESGVVFISGKSTYDQRVSYIILNKEIDKLSVTIKGHKDETILFAEENLDGGNYSSKYIEKLGLYINNLTPQSLY